MEIIIGLIIVAAVLAFIAHHFAIKKAKEDYKKIYFIIFFI